VALTPSVKDALGMVRDHADLVEQGQKVQVLVTGSLHLVGAMLGSLEDVDAL
jgi:folylpolyglutamate synthase